MHMLEQYRPAILQAWNQHLPVILGYNHELAPMLEHHMNVLGKLLRPMLTVAFYEILRPTDPHAENKLSQVIQAALANEMLHNGTLVHDDLQDGDEVRRGHPTVWKAFSPYQAINTGNALYFHAQRMICTLDLPAPTVVKLMQLLCHYSLAIINGQAAEKLLWPRIQPHDGQAHEPFGMKREEAVAYYLEIVQGKTSALFALPLVMALTIAEENPESIHRINDLANPLGALFQIQDDLLDLYGNKGRDSVGNDIAEGKPSLPAIQCLYLASPQDAHRLFTIIQKPREQTSPQDIRWAIDTIRETGAMKASLKTIETLRTQALEHCRKLPLRVPANVLADLLESLCTTILQPIAHLY